jgi:hypothetical protein
MYEHILAPVLFVEFILILFCLTSHFDLDLRWCRVDFWSIKAGLARFIDRERTRWKPIKPFPLFRLPPEIRERIYSFMVPTCDSCIYVGPNTEESRQREPFCAQRRTSLLSIWSCDTELFQETEDVIGYRPYPCHR